MLIYRNQTLNKNIEKPIEIPEHLKKVVEETNMKIRDEARAREDKKHKIQLFAFLPGSFHAGGVCSEKVAKRKTMEVDDRITLGEFKAEVLAAFEYQGPSQAQKLFILKKKSRNSYAPSKVFDQDLDTSSLFDLGIRNGEEIFVASDDSTFAEANQELFVSVGLGKNLSITMTFSKVPSKQTV